MPISEADAAAGGQCQRRDDQADPRAVDQAAQDVAAERVGAEQVLVLPPSTQNGGISLSRKVWSIGE